MRSPRNLCLNINASALAVDFGARMTPSHYLRPLLAPDSVALVGASERPGSPGRVVYENILAGEFKGELYAVNPGHAKVLGRPAYASLAAIGRPVDLAVICAPAAAVPGILKCERGRLRAAAILSGAPTATPAEYRRWRREIIATKKVAGRSPPLSVALRWIVASAWRDGAAEARRRRCRLSPST